MAIEYPIWKKALIEAGRVFVGAMIAQLTLLIFRDDQIDFNFIYSIKSWEQASALLIIPSVAAGLKGLIKYLREKYAVNRLGNTDYDNVLFKVPV